MTCQNITQAWSQLGEALEKDTAPCLRWRMPTWTRAETKAAIMSIGVEVMKRGGCIWAAHEPTRGPFCNLLPERVLHEAGTALAIFNAALEPQRAAMKVTTSLGT